MKTFASFAALFSVVALLFVPMPATATGIADCQAQIGTLVLQTQGTTFLGDKPAKAEAKLEGELLAASDKLDKAKLNDAIKKMTDYEKDVATMAGKGTLATADADALTAGAADVITCIQQIGQ